jgi:hypothetical protein
MKVTFTRSTAIISCVALLASALIGYAIGRANSNTTPNFRNQSSSGPPVLSGLGVYPGYASVPQLQSVDSWLGRDANYVVQFADGNIDNFDGSVWGQVVNAGALQTVSGQVKLVESIPLAFGGFVDTSTPAGQASVRAALQATVNGSNDSQFRFAAGYLKSGGFSDAVIRLGWEFDGGWMPWSSVGNEALWASAFRHVVDVFRSVSPSFRFDWNGDPSFMQTQTAAYPGDGYVDIIGLDVYDKGIPVAWNSSTLGWSDPTAAFNWELTNLRWQRDFALAHGKQVSYPEWGLSGVNASTTSKVGGDDPTFVRGMYEWMNSLPASGAGSLAYHSYFNEDADDGNHRLTANFFPMAQALFKTLFGANASVTAPPATTPPATPPPTTAPPTTTPPTTTPPPTPTPPTTTPPTTTAPAPTTVPASATPDPTSGSPTPPPVTTVPTPATTSPTRPDPTRVAAVPTQVIAQVIPAGRSATNIARESRWRGARSAPYVCCWIAQGQYVAFSFNAAGPTTLALRYSAGNGTAHRKVVLDGKVFVANQRFPVTGTWNAWSNVVLNVNLPAGRHTLTVWLDHSSGSKQYVNLDSLAVTSTLVLPARAAQRDVGIESIFSGSQSAPYVCCWLGQGRYVTFAFNSVGGASNLGVRYSAGNGFATRKVELDGAVLAANQSFGATASWNTWSTVTLKADLAPGRHTVKVWDDETSGSAQYLNLDSLSVRAG